MSPFELAHYKEALLFLATAGLVVPLFRRLKINPVIGFLIAGVLLGPAMLGALAQRIGPLAFLAFDDVAEIAPVAELGIVFLLFTIGLELSWERLVRLRRLVFGLGALQVFGSAAALGAVALLFRVPPAAALVLGFALALSSTAVVIPVLAERKRLASAGGRTIFSVLLFQDLMVAPLLFMVSVLGTRGGNLGSLVAATLLPALGALLVIVLGGRLIVRPLFHHVAAAGSTEFFMAACLLTVLGTGLIAAASGLSMGLGAFIAGLLLAETEYRREIEVTIEPFKGLLLGLFFVSIGAGLDLAQMLADPLPVIVMAAALLAAKTLTTFLAGRLLRVPHRVALEAALMLGPGGEFAFVMVAAAAASQALPHRLAAAADIAVTLTMFAVPGLAALSQRLRRGLPPADLALADIPPPSTAAASRAILIGYGRVGQVVGDMMRGHGFAYLAVDENVATVRRFRSEGVEIAWGNASRIEFLLRCGLAEAKALILTIDASNAAEEIVVAARRVRPDLTIVARARDATHAARLYALGVTDAVPETIEASLQLSEAVLVDLGVPLGHVIAAVHEKRDEYRRLLQPPRDDGPSKPVLRVTRARPPRARRRARGERRDPG